MIKLESTAVTQRIYKVLTEEDAAGGFYVYIYETFRSKSPDRDYFQGKLEMAKAVCTEEFGVPFSVGGWQDCSTEPSLWI